MFQLIPGNEPFGAVSHVHPIYGTGYENNELSMSVSVSRPIAHFMPTFLLYHLISYKGHAVTLKVHNANKTN